MLINWTLGTNSNFRIPIFLQPDGLHLLIHAWAIWSNRIQSFKDQPASDCTDLEIRKYNFRRVFSFSEHCMYLKYHYFYLHKYFHQFLKKLVLYLYSIKSAFVIFLIWSFMYILYPVSTVIASFLSSKYPDINYIYHVYSIQYPQLHIYHLNIQI